MFPSEGGKKEAMASNFERRSVDTEYRRQESGRSAGETGDVDGP